MYCDNYYAISILKPFLNEKSTAGCCNTSCNYVSFHWHFYPLFKIIRCLSKTLVTKTIWFLLVNTTWKWQNVTNYWKNRNKKFCGLFRYDVIQERAWFRAFLTLILEKMVFTSKYNMEMTKREKIIEKYEKKIWGDFF